MKKEILFKTMKKIVENAPSVLATSIPVVGEVWNLVKDSYDEVQLDKKLKELDDEIDELDDELDKKLEEKFEEFTSFRCQFENAKKNLVVKDEEYELQNINCIEIFFADYIEINDGEFIDKLTDALKTINEECTVHGTYGCVYENYILNENSLQIIFEETFEREYVEEYIENIKYEIEDGWHFESPISKVRYY